MELLHGDAYLGAKAELTAVRKPGGGVDVDTGGIDLLLETARVRQVFRHDRFAVMCAVAVNVSDRFVDSGYVDEDVPDARNLICRFS